MRVPRRLSFLHKEMAIVAVVALMVVALSTSSVRMEPLYEGLMAVDLAAVLQLRAQGTDQVYPRLAIGRTPNGPPNRGAEVVVLSSVGKGNYPLSNVRVLCRAGAPSPLEESVRRFAHGIRSHCEFRLSPEAQDRLVRTSEISNRELERQRFYLDSLPITGLLIQCQDLIPMRFVTEDRAFSAWIKANCTFVPSWVP